MAAQRLVQFSQTEIAGSRDGSILVKFPRKLHFNHVVVTENREMTEDLPT